MSGGLGLNLVGADITSGFPAVDSGTYRCKIMKVDPKPTKGSEGSVLPAGTPAFNVQFKISDGGEFDGRMLFKQYIIPPTEINGAPYENYDMMRSILGGFFAALGWTKDEITKKGFNPSGEELVGRELLVTAKKKTKYGTKPEDEIFDNEVSGVRPLPENDNGAASLL